MSTYWSDVDWSLSAERYGQEFALPPKLILALIQVESGGNPWACRFEPVFLDRYVMDDPKRFGPISLQTERLARATSYGLMQVMGETARGMGCELIYLTELCDPQQGIYWGTKYLSTRWNKYHEGHGLDGVIAAYNAGRPRKGVNGFANQAYVEKVLKEMV